MARPAISPVSYTVLYLVYERVELYWLVATHIIIVHGRKNFGQRERAGLAHPSPVECTRRLLLPRMCSSRGRSASLGVSKGSSAFYAPGAWRTLATRPVLWYSNTGGQTSERSKVEAQRRAAAQGARGPADRKTGTTFEGTHLAPASPQPPAGSTRAQTELPRS